MSTSTRSYFIRLGIGFVAFVVMPSLIVLSYISGIGVPLGFFLLFAWLTLLLMAIPVASITLGVYIVGVYIREKGTSAQRLPIGLPSAIVGGLSMALIVLVPFLGVIIFLMFMLSALGALVQFLFERFRRASQR